jgi:phosphopantetheinyl transferase (holo-ACP synthase)
MIGNDVIDLQQSRQESNWQRKGFLEKLFTTDEQLLIAQNPEPEIMVWMLWSMKEAAYKIYNRQTKIRQYIPKKLVCTVLSQNENYISGQVICLENIYHTKTKISNDSIHTIAILTADDFNNVIEIENKGISKDTNGIPYLLNTASNTLHDVSISHHGQFEKVVTFCN